jgi:hypothetical protein
MHDYKPLICIKNRKGGVINFGIVVPQKKGQYIHAGLYG